MIAFFRTFFRKSCIALLATTAFTMPVFADGHAPAWLTMPADVFAKTYLDQAFSADPSARFEIAWMLFARVNQQIDANGQTVSAWEAWPSDHDTFTPSPSFVFGEKVRNDPHFVTSKRVLAGEDAQSIAAGGGEEVSRNMLGYEYLTGKGMNTAVGVSDYLNAGNMVQMPIGSLEVKAIWVKINTATSSGAYAFQDKYALGGMHIMFKMSETPADTYTNPTPSWFWTTFEFDGLPGKSTGNPGLDHLRTTLIDQPLTDIASARTSILEAAGLAGTPFENYSPNGTQITFEESGEFKVLGHTMMEGFAGHPSGDPAAWTSFTASCHACHATASWNPKTDKGNSMPQPVGKLSAELVTGLENAGFKPIDFMWPIVFSLK
jgi:hypothetical protein